MEVLQQVSNQLISLASRELEEIELDFLKQAVYVSNQLISLASREGLSDLLVNNGMEVSNQLISLASREFGVGRR